MNQGDKFERLMYIELKHLLEDGKLLVSPENTAIFLGKKYYSLQRQDYIQMDITIEKFYEKDSRCPSIILVFECKDYNGSIPVDDVEEFHAKLQQIGADNTKGFIITRNGRFQRSAISYAKANGIALAKIILNPLEVDAITNLKLLTCIGIPSGLREEAESCAKKYVQSGIYLHTLKKYINNEISKFM